MSRTSSGVTCRGLPDAKHEAERVGAQGHREERVLLVRDPTDLHEHGADGTGRRSRANRADYARPPHATAERSRDGRAVAKVDADQSRAAARDAAHRTPFSERGALDHRRRRVAAGVLWSALDGLPSRPVVAALARGDPGLVCWRNPEPVLRVVWDWLPILVIAAGYDLVRSQAPDLVPRAVTEPQLRFDEIVFGGTAPTVLLQDALVDRGRLALVGLPGVGVLPVALPLHARDRALAVPPPSRLVPPVRGLDPDGEPLRAS